MKYLVVVEKGPTGYSAFVPDLPGCVAAGETEAEVRELMGEAVPFHVEGMRLHGEDVPAPTCSSFYAGACRKAGRVGGVLAALRALKQKVGRMFWPARPATKKVPATKGR